MSKYFIRINCISFQDYVITARNKADAIAAAEKHFQCNSTEGEFGEFLDEDSLVRAEEYEIFYPVKPTTQEATE